MWMWGRNPTVVRSSYRFRCQGIEVARVAHYHNTCHSWFWPCPVCSAKPAGRPAAGSGGIAIPAITLIRSLTGNEKGGGHGDCRCHWKVFILRLLSCKEGALLAWDENNIVAPTHILFPKSARSGDKRKVEPEPTVALGYQLVDWLKEKATFRQSCGLALLGQAM